MNRHAAQGSARTYNNRDSSFTQMMQRYGMGGARAETSPKEASQLLQSSGGVWANKVKDTGRIMGLITSLPCLIQ